MGIRKNGPKWEDDSLNHINTSVLKIEAEQTNRNRIWEKYKKLNKRLKNDWDEEK